MAKTPAIPEERRGDDNLTPRMRMGAYMEARGLSREEVAEAVGVSVTSVSRWRKEPEYQQAIQTWQAAELEAIENLFGRYRFAAVEAALKAINTDVEALKAMHPEHPEAPDWKVRREASESLRRHAQELLQIVAGGAGDPAQAKAAAAITVNIQSSRDDIIEGTVVSED